MSAISSKVKEGDFLVIDNLNVDVHKTSSLVLKLHNLGLSSVLFVDSSTINDNFKNAASNIIKIDALPEIGLNVYDILNHKKLVFTQDAVKKIVERLNGVN
jgi:large subunit ribosomal protein L4